MNEPVIPHHQLSRAALLWLLAGCAACVLLLSAYMPWWLLPVTALCLTWRLLIFQGRLAFPAKWQKTVLVLTVSLGLLLQFRGGVSLDLFVALLLLAFSLKLLVVYRRQDAHRLL